MSRTTSPRPCKLPQIQIDTWGAHARRQKSCHVTARSVAQQLCVTHAEILARSALHGAYTIREIVNAIISVTQPLHVCVKAGQVYMHSSWRVRYKDMSTNLQAAVMSIRDTSNLQQEFENYYDSSTVIDLMYRFIGPARAEGARSLLPRHRSTTTT